MKINGIEVKVLECDFSWWDTDREVEFELDNGDVIRVNLMGPVVNVDGEITLEYIDRKKYVSGTLTCTSHELETWRMRGWEQDETFISRMYDQCSGLLLDLVPHCEDEREVERLWEQIIYLNTYVIDCGLIESDQRVSWEICKELHRRGEMSEEDFQSLSEGVVKHNLGTV